MPRLTNLSIAWKQALVIATLLALCATIGLVTYGKIGVVERSSAAVARNHSKIEELRSISATALAQQQSLSEYLTTGAPDALDHYRRGWASFAQAFATMRSYSADPAQLQRDRDLGLLAASWQDTVDRGIAAGAPADPDRQARTITASRDAMTGVLDKIVEIDAASHRLLAERQITASDAFATMRTVLLAGGGLILLVLLVAGWGLKSGISTPIQVLTGVMHRLAAGDTGVGIPAQIRRDEIGRMAAAVQVFKDNALARAQLEAGSAALRQAADRERVQREDERAAAAAAASAVVSALATGLEQLAGGDLTMRLERAFSPEYEALRANYNMAVGALQDAMRAIGGSAQAVHMGSGEISQAADDLSRRTEQQAASLEQTAAALDEITTAVRQTAEGAVQARNVVAKAKADAEHSGQIVREAVAAMGGIEDSSSKIGQIIGVIDEIAFQTNLLALNAGVEAARAGDAGRGFAVVASEVRALAQRSAGAAREIKALIAASARQVHTGVRLVGQTGQSLTQIVEQVAEMSAVVTTIANSAQLQASGLQEVSTAVNHMDQVTQQNAAMVEQSTAASHALSQEAEELARLTGQFVLDGSNAASPEARLVPRSLAVQPLMPVRKAG